jgi:hypothetical protein
MNTTALVVQRWRDQGIVLNAPALEAELELLKDVFGGAPPRELVQFYEAANGMADAQMDVWHASFWSIQRVARVHNTLRGDESQWFAFGDFLIDSWFFRISREGRVMVESTDEIFEGLSHFFEAYLARPESLGLVRS